MKIFFILDLWKWIRKQHRFFSVKELSWFVWMFQRAPNSESTMPAGLWGLSLRVLKWSPQEFTSYTTGTAQFVSVYIKNVFVHVHIPLLFLFLRLHTSLSTGPPPQNIIYEPGMYSIHNNLSYQSTRYIFLPPMCINCDLWPM